MKDAIKKASIMQRAGWMLDGGAGDTYGESCGAFTGGLMVISGMYGRSETETSDCLCQKAAVQWRGAFKEEFGWMKCGDLRADWVGMFGQESCSELVAKAAGLLIDLLSENIE